jgi:hypothetical protein
MEPAGLPVESSSPLASGMPHTFDPLRLVDKLKAALEKALAPIRTDLAVLKWMIGVLLAGVVSLVLKAFF